jgi:hypothetical protein
MNTGSGKNMNWFWKKWFFDNGEPDLAITKVTTKGNSTSVLITSIGTKPVPVDLTVYYSDSSSIRIHKTIAVWEKGNNTVTIPVISTKKIIRLVLGYDHTPDSNKKDNVWIVR